jgi:hypothetical protein
MKIAWLKKVALALGVVFVLPIVALVLAACGTDGETVYHVVTYMSEDQQTVLGYSRVEDGGQAVYTGMTPTKQSAEPEINHYVFAGWTDEKGAVANLVYVKGDMTVYASFEQKLVDYTLTKPDRVSVTRRGSALQDGDIIHYGDELYISYTLTSEETLADLKVNGSTFPNGAIFTVTGNVEIIFLHGTATFCNVNFLGPDGEVLPTVEAVAYGSKAEEPNVTVNGYTLIGWDSNFSKPITSDISIQGYFYKNDEVYSSATVAGTGLTVGETWTMSLSAGNPLFDYFESEFGTGNVPSTLEMRVSEIFDDVDEQDNKNWGDIDCHITLTVNGENFRCGYFKDADIITISTQDWGIDANHIYFARKSGSGNLTGTYVLCEEIYGLDKYRGVSYYAKEEDKYAGVSVQATGDSEDSVWTLSISQGNPIFDYFESKFGEGNVPSTIELTVEQLDYVNETDLWVEESWGDIEYYFVLKNDDYGFSCYAGYYCFGDVLVIDSSSLGIGLSNIYFVKVNGSGYGAMKGTYYLYKKIYGLKEDMATVSFVDFNGNILLTTTNRVGAYTPKYTPQTSIEGYTFIGQSSDEILKTGINNCYLLYVKDDEKEDVTLTFTCVSSSSVTVDDTILCEMSTDSNFYQYLLSKYEDVSTTTTWKVTNMTINQGYLYYVYVKSVQGVENGIEIVRYYQIENVIAFSTGEELESGYFVNADGKFGDGAAFTYYKKIYSYNDSFSG